MTESFSVETQHGTMVGRPGDHLMLGVTGQVYVVGGEEFARCYIATPDPLCAVTEKA